MDDKMLLSTALEDSINGEISDVISDLAEIGLDSLFDEGVLREIPFISTAVSVYRIGRSISERHYIKKLLVFLKSVNEKIVDEDKRRLYMQRISNDPNKRSKELEYVLIIIDRYVGYDKPTMLAKLYLAFLEGNLSWREFALYAEITDRFIIGDYDMLMSDSELFSTTYSDYNESIFRLVALGLVAETSYPTAFEDLKKGFGVSIESLEKIREGEVQYKRTRLGERFVSIMNERYN